MNTSQIVHMKIVSVTVVADPKTGQSKIEVDPEKLKSGTNENVKIVWHLQTPGWYFPTDGIVIDDHDHVFKDVQPVDERDGFMRGFYCVNANNAKRTYSYWIKVLPTTPQLDVPAIRKDPTIENQDK